jgi:hypothetical protein
MSVKAEKTFEEIVERLAALFKLRPRPVERNYEESIDLQPPSASPFTKEPARPPKTKAKNRE